MTLLDDYFLEIESKIEKEGFSIKNFKKINYGLQFEIVSEKWSELIRIYQNNKGIIRDDFSQIKNDENLKIIKKILEINELTPNTDSIEKTDFEFGYPIIGTDESGKGDYFGPLVVAGVYLEEDIAEKLKKLGVRDSKLISDVEILSLATKIKTLCSKKYSVVELSPTKYNELYEKFRSENKNLNTLLAWAHAKVIENLLETNRCPTVLTDKFADEKFLNMKLQERGKTIKLIQITKAENNIAVAAASILARSRFLEKIEKLSKEHQIEFPKGSSSKVIDVAKKLIQIEGEGVIKKVAKMHFKTTEQLFLTE